MKIWDGPFGRKGKGMRDVDGQAAIVRPERWRSDGKGQNPVDLESLYRESFQKVYNYAYYRLLDPALAEDLTSIAFIKAVENFDRYDPSKAKFSTWVTRIAHNAIVDYYRTRKPTSTLDDLGANEPSCVDDYPELDEHAKEVVRLLEYISEEDREIVYLKYNEEKSNVEIAQILDMNPSTVATRLHRALATMRKHVQ